MNKLETLKCIEITSQRQADNGTICYFDPQTNAYYMLYENGYVRRSYTTVSWRTGKKLETIYQLNPTRKSLYVSPYSGQTYDTVERVMIPTHDQRVDCAANAVVNYRETCKKRKLELVNA